MDKSKTPTEIDLSPKRVDGVTSEPLTPEHHAQWLDVCAANMTDLTAKQMIGDAAAAIRGFVRELDRVRTERDRAWGMVPDGSGYIKMMKTFREQDRKSVREAINGLTPDVMGGIVADNVVARPDGKVRVKAQRILAALLTALEGEPTT